MIFCLRSGCMLTYNEIPGQPFNAGIIVKQSRWKFPFQPHLEVTGYSYRAHRFQTVVRERFVNIYVTCLYFEILRKFRDEPALNSVFGLLLFRHTLLLIDRMLTHRSGRNDQVGILSIVQFH